MFGYAARMTSAWSEDLDGILERASIPAALRDHLDTVRSLMADAWQFGYTTGMADSAKLDEQLQGRATMTETTDPDPRTLDNAVTAITDALLGSPSIESVTRDDHLDTPGSVRLRINGRLTSHPDVRFSVLADMH